MSTVLVIGENPMDKYGFDRVKKRVPVERASFEFACEAQLTDALIQKVQPRSILALGPVALDTVTGFSEIHRYRGYTLDSEWGIPVIGTYHPLFLVPKKHQQSGSKLVGVAMWDILRAVEIAEQGYVRESVDYLIDPPIDACWQFVREALLADFLAWDLETTGKGKVEEDRLKKENWDDTINRASYASRARQALTIPWSGEYMAIHRALLASQVAKVGWNSRGFDDPLVRMAGLELNGVLYDGMEAWHVLQPTLRKKLEFVSSFYCSHLLPWKHLYTTDFQRYSAIDADATICNWLGIMASLQKSRIAPELTRVA